MTEINIDETRNFFSTVVGFLFIINLTIAITSFNDGFIFIAQIFLSIIPSILLLRIYSGNRKGNPQDQ